MTFQKLTLAVLVAAQICCGHAVAQCDPYPNGPWHQCSYGPRGGAIYGVTPYIARRMQDWSFYGGRNPYRGVPEGYYPARPREFNFRQYLGPAPMWPPP